MSPHTFSLFSLLTTACTGKITEEPWLLPQQSLGADQASGAGMDLSPQNAWYLVQQVTPTLSWDDPALNTVEQVFNAMLDDQGISDEGSCPYTIAEGPTLTWISNCRSQDGYDWQGSVSRTDGEDAENSVTWTRWSLDLEVTSAEDFADLSRVTLRGEIYQATGDGNTDLVKALQTNVEVGVVDYLEALNGDDYELAAWSDWRLTLRAEQHQASQGTRLLLAGKTDLGPYGGAAFEALDLLLPDACPNEVDGTFTLDASSRATLDFQGSSGCDRCGILHIKGQDDQDACPQ